METFDNIWAINPSNSGAYGALLFVLIASVIYLSKQIVIKDNKIHELTTKLHEALDLVTNKLHDIKLSHSELKALNEKTLFYIENKIKNVN